MKLYVEYVPQPDEINRMPHHLAQAVRNGNRLVYGKARYYQSTNLDGRAFYTHGVPEIVPLYMDMEKLTSKSTNGA